MIPRQLKLISSLFLLLFFCISNISAQNFEGNIVFKSTFPNSFNGTFTIKDNMAMLDSEGRNGMMKLIADADSGEKKIITQDDEGDIIMITKRTNDMQYRKTKHQYKKGNVRIKNTMVKVTRETKKINGYKCYKVVASNNKHEGEAWMTKKLDFDPIDLFPIMKIHHGRMPRVARAMKNSMDGIIMEMTIKDIKTKKIDRMSVSIEKKKINDKTFEVDTSDMKVYTEENVREMMKEARGNPTKMKKARTLLAQIRMQ